jgi:hypothetical protein
MSITLSLALNILVLGAIFLYLNARVTKLLRKEALLDRVREEIEGLVLELNQTTERNIGLIEDRINILKQFLDTADKRIVLIGRETEKHETTNRLYNNLARKKAREQAPNEEPAKKSFNPGEVLDLHRKGISAGIIANKLGTTVGEVDLIISLQDRKDQA